MNTLEIKDNMYQGQEISQYTPFYLTPTLLVSGGQIHGEI